MWPILGPANLFKTSLSDDKTTLAAPMYLLCCFVLGDMTLVNRRRHSVSIIK
jgi:hypothetical protein